MPTDPHSALGVCGFAHVGLSHAVQVTEQSRPHRATPASQPLPLRYWFLVWIGSGLKIALLCKIDVTFILAFKKCE